VVEINTQVGQNNLPDLSRKHNLPWSLQLSYEMKVFCHPTVQFAGYVQNTEEDNAVKDGHAFPPVRSFVWVCVSDCVSVFVTHTSQEYFDEI
jgi:hypothetical protein